MQEQLITFETAKLAKEKGFNIRQSAYYDEHANLCEVYSCYCNDRDVNECSCGAWESYDEGEKAIQTPTQALLQKWLREVHGIEIAIQWFDTYYIKAVAKKPFKANTYRVEGFQLYEEALETGLQEALKLISIVKDDL